MTPPVFSQKDLHIMYAIVDGKSDKEIAYELNTTRGTIKIQIVRIRQKLEAFYNQEFSIRRFPIMVNEFLHSFTTYSANQRFLANVKSNT